MRFIFVFLLLTVTALAEPSQRAKQAIELAHSLKSELTAAQLELSIVKTELSSAKIGADSANSRVSRLEGEIKRLSDQISSLKVSLGKEVDKNMKLEKENTSLKAKVVETGRERDIFLVGIAIALASLASPLLAKATGFVVGLLPGGGFAQFLVPLVKPLIFCAATVAAFGAARVAVHVIVSLVAGLLKSIF